MLALIIIAILVCIAWALFSAGLFVLGIIPCLLILVVVMAVFGKLDDVLFPH